MNLPDPAVHPLHVTVLGTGYVGLVSAACLAAMGHAVAGVDTDAAKVAALQRGAMPIFEAGLQPLVAEQMRLGRLSFTRDLADALGGAELVVVAVGTPAGADGATNLGAVHAAVDQIGMALSHPLTVVIKSTVPVGTSDAMQHRLRRVLAGRGLDWTVPVLNNPEFLREGTATQDFLQPDRIVVGAARRRDAEVLRRAYEPLTRQGVPLLVVGTRSAELGKYAANTMLATRISFMNEMADIAEATGADIEEVREAVGSDRRIGTAFLRAGIGYGGSCFPKDVSSLRHQARSQGVAPLLLEAVARKNAQHLRWPVERLVVEVGGPRGLNGLRVAVWGLAFKPGTDDLREAASLVVLDALLQAGARVTAHDPVAMRHAVAVVPPHPALTWAATAAEALAGAEALLLLTEWPEYVDFPPERAAAALRGRLVLDGRNALPADRWAAAGLRVCQVGRPVRVDAAAGAATVRAGARPGDAVPAAVTRPRAAAAGD